MTVIYQKTITKEELQFNPDTLYLFCENAELQGHEGLASELRGEENAVGIRLKLRPGNREDSHIDEDNSFEGMSMIDEDLDVVIEHARAGGTVVVPIDGFIPRKLCQSVADYLRDQLEMLSDL